MFSQLCVHPSLSVLTSLPPPTPAYEHVLRGVSLNPNVKKAEYAVRGELFLLSQELQAKLRSGEVLVSEIFPHPIVVTTNTVHGTFTRDAAFLQADILPYW